MSAHRVFVATVLLAASVAVPGTAAAQTLQSPLPVYVGQTVRITSTDGKVTKGKIQTLTPALVILEVPGGSATQVKEPVSLAIADVQRIQAPDSVTNGVVIGALTLGAVGALWGAAGDTVTDLASVIVTGKGDDSSHVLTFAVAGAAAGALLGYAIDAARVKTIYERPDTGMSVSVRPIVSATGKGVGVRVQW